jgi:hypothetical protein
MAAALQFERDGDEGVDVAEGADVGEDDAHARLKRMLSYNIGFCLLSTRDDGPVRAGPLLRLATSVLPLPDQLHIREAC